MSRRDIILTRTIEAPLERVWQAWTDSEQLRRWWGPRGFTSPSCRMEFREGGRFVWCMRAPAEHGGFDLYTSGVFKKIVPLERIEFDQGLSDEHGDRIDPTTIGMPADFPRDIPSVLEFKRVGARTELRAIEYEWAAGPMADLSEQGLGETLDKLVEVVEGEPGAQR